MSRSGSTASTKCAGSTRRCALCRTPSPSRCRTAIPGRCISATRGQPHRGLHPDPVARHPALPLRRRLRPARPALKDATLAAAKTLDGFTTTEEWQQAFEKRFEPAKERRFQPPPSGRGGPEGDSPKAGEGAAAGKTLTLPSLRDGPRGEGFSRTGVAIMRNFPQFGHVRRARFPARRRHRPPEPRLVRGDAASRARGGGRVARADRGRPDDVLSPRPGARLAGGSGAGCRFPGRTVARIGLSSRTPPPGSTRSSPHWRRR